MCDGFGKTKNLFLLTYFGKKQVPIAVGEPLERWEVGTGWVQIRQRSVPILIIGLGGNCLRLVVIAPVQFVYIEWWLMLVCVR